MSPRGSKQRQSGRLGESGTLASWLSRTGPPGVLSLPSPRRPLQPGGSGRSTKYPPERTAERRAGAAPLLRRADRAGIGPGPARDRGGAGRRLHPVPLQAPSNLSSRRRPRPETTSFRKSWVPAPSVAPRRRADTEPPQRPDSRFAARPGTVATQRESSAGLLTGYSPGHNLMSTQEHG